MWPVIMAMARTYAPYVVLPIATVIGFVGNYLKNCWLDILGLGGLVAWWVSSYFHSSLSPISST